GPVTAGAHAVVVAGDDNQRHAGLLAAHGGVVDKGLRGGGEGVALGEVAGPAALGDLAGLVGGDLVADADVGEGAAGHDAVVAAARAVAVEVLLLDALAEEVLAAGGVLADGACGRDVVGGDAVAEEGEAAG